MKKKLVVLMLVGMSLCTTACGGDSNTTGENAQATETVATETPAEEATENPTNTQTEATTQEDAESNEEVQIDEAKLEENLNGTLDWIAMQYTCVENPDIKELTVAQAIPMAVAVVGVNQEDLESDEEYNLIIPDDLLEDTMKNLFGTSYDTSEYTPAEYDKVVKAEDGSLRYKLGDWGLGVPKFSVEGIEKDTDSDDFVATVNYYIYDAEKESNSETEYVVRYYLAPDEESAYGFVITNLVGEKATVAEE